MPIGLTVFHALSGEIETAAERADRAIDQRYMPFVQNLSPFFRSTPGWPMLAKRMNLPA